MARHGLSWGYSLLSATTSLSSPVTGGGISGFSGSGWQLVGVGWGLDDTLGLVFWSGLVFAFRSRMMMMIMMMIIPTASIGHMFRYTSCFLSFLCTKWNGSYHAVLMLCVCVCVCVKLAALDGIGGHAAQYPSGQLLDTVKLRFIATEQWVDQLKPDPCIGPSG
jgi:hypothetical protein